jgi:hypothetical protein
MDNNTNVTLVKIDDNLSPINYIDNAVNNDYVKLLLAIFFCTMAGYTLGPLPRNINNLISGNDIKSTLFRIFMLFFASLITLDEKTTNYQNILFLLFTSITIILIFKFTRQIDIDAKNKNNNVSNKRKL